MERNKLNRQSPHLKMARCLLLSTFLADTRFSRLSVVFEFEGERQHGSEILGAWIISQYSAQFGAIHSDAYFHVCPEI